MNPQPNTVAPFYAQYRRALCELRLAPRIFALGRWDRGALWRR